MKLSFDRINTLLSKALKIEPQQLESSLRPATEQDFEDIIDFRKNYFNEELPWDDRAYLRWRYNFSHIGGENQNIFWVLNIEGDLLGVIGTECLDLVVNSEVKKAYHPLDILVKPELDGLGLGAWLSLAINEKYDIILAVGANENSKSLFKKMFHPMPDRNTWKLMFRSESLIRKHIKIPPLVTFVSVLVDQLLLIRRLIKKSYSLPNGAEIIVVERFINDVDEWRLPEKGYPWIYRLRSGKYLNWRFIDNPRRDYDVLGLYINGKMIAYVVYHTWISSNQNQTVAGIDDFFWDSQAIRNFDITYNKVLILLFSKVIDKILISDASNIRLTNYGEFIESALNSMGFITRSEEEVFGVFTQSENLKAILYDEKAWFLTDTETHSEGF